MAAIHVIHTCRYRIFFTYSIQLGLKTAPRSLLFNCPKTAKEALCTLLVPCSRCSWGNFPFAAMPFFFSAQPSLQDASFELVSRIMKFVDYKLDKISPVTFDSSLISMTLQTELYVSQRGEYLELLPICNLTKAHQNSCFTWGNRCRCVQVSTSKRLP